VNSLNWEGMVARKVGRLPYIYYSSSQECNYGYRMLPTVFGFDIVLGMANKDIPP
jgi:hypothetical protein